MNLDNLEKALKEKSYEEALVQLNELKGFYMAGRTTDSHLLSARGLPFFSDYLLLVSETLKALGPSFNSLSWLKESKDAVDEDGQKAVQTVGAEITSLFPITDLNNSQLKGGNIHLNEKPAVFVVEGIFTIKHSIIKKETVFAIRMRQGILRVKSTLRFKTKNGTNVEAKILSMDIFRRPVDEASPGDLVTIRLEKAKENWFAEGLLVEIQE